jgi:hypothetical protein
MASGKRRVGWLAALAAGAVAMAPAVAPPRQPTQPQILDAFGVDWTADGLQRMAERYGLLILHNLPKTRQALPALKRRNPRAIALMYRELYCVLREETPHQQSVGGYDWIDANHPEWFQLDTRGRRVEIPDYPGRWLMDLGNPQWQAFWIERTLRDVVESGWDGAYADDAITTVRAHDLPPLANYPDDASLQAAVTGFLARVYPVFQQAGKQFLINASETYRYPGLWDRWLDHADGILEEHFAGQGWTWGDDVAREQLAAFQRAAARGKYALAMTYGPWEDVERMQGSLAAYWLVAGPKTFWIYRPVHPSSRPVWHQAWDADLGPPLGEVEAEDDDLRRRRFARGEAIVNVGKHPQHIETSNGARTVPPKSGIILGHDPATGAALQPRAP